MKKKLISALLCASMVAAMVSGCGSSSSETATTTDSASDSAESTTATEAASDEADTTAADTTSTEVKNDVAGDPSADDAFVIWGWNQDIQKILDGPFKEAYPEDYKRIVFVNTGGSDYYRTKVDEIFGDESNELYPDMMGLEVDYVLNYVDGDYLQNVADLGITPDDYANQYQYNLDLGTDYDGNVKALFWQATPGCFQVRADLAEKYLGTTDPQELHDQYFSSTEAMVAAAEKVKEASGGVCKLFSGYDELLRMYSNSRTTGWYDDNDTIQVDKNMEEYMDFAKTCLDEDLTYGTDQWGTDWYANMDGDGTTSNAALAFCGCPWFTYWCLSDTWKSNTILVAGPEDHQFYWGGTGLAATAGCSDTELAGKIMKAITCDTDFMVKINESNSDYVNNTEAIKQISASGATCEYLYGDQSVMDFYLPMAENISATTSTAEDQDINSFWSTQVRAYADGTSDKDTAIANFKSAVHDKFSYLSAE